MAVGRLDRKRRALKAVEDAWFAQYRRGRSAGVVQRTSDRVYSSMNRAFELGATPSEIDASMDRALARSRRTPSQIARRDHGSEFIGMRVQISPRFDRWMMGDRYGAVVRKGRGDSWWVKMDRSGKTIRYNRADLEEIGRARTAGDRSRRLARS